MKPSHRRTVTKMWKALLKADENLGACHWKFYVNSSDEIQQKDTDYVCGVHVCMYARTLVFNCPPVHNDHMMDQRKAIIHDLHFQTLSLSTQMDMEVGSYYAVDYVSKFYYGRVISIRDEFITLKFLRATSTSTFGWPRRDHVEKVHKSCIFFGPVKIQGNDPTSISVPLHSEVIKVHQLIKNFNL